MASQGEPISQSSNAAAMVHGRIYAYAFRFTPAFAIRASGHVSRHDRHHHCVVSALPMTTDSPTTKLAS
jgi:hypothetical protein